ncbi:endoribonuclease YicC domain-containing protein [Planktomarina temperata]|uniref:endoribonuclease YicC domain-containing protein n=1 Tax=Planktomarina temperata TaxID=1284658 RepID=UPI003D36C20C
MQELNREANTLASKSINTETTKHSVLFAKHLERRKRTRDCSNPGPRHAQRQ